MKEKIILVKIFIVKTNIVNTDKIKNNMINGSANSRIGYIDGGLKNDIHEGCSMQGQAYKVLEGAQKTCIKTKILILRNSDQRPTTNPINIYDNRKIIMMCLI